MKYTVVVPYVYEPYKEMCLANCKLEDVYLVNNCKHNIGIMKSHNLGIQKMRRDNSDWLIILSCAIRFGARGGLDFIEALEKTTDKVLEVADVFGWHFIAFSKEVIEKVGNWDENFTPYGYDDLDYSWRIQLAFDMDHQKQLWSKVKCDVTDAGMAHSIHLGKIKTQKEEELRAYWKRKWGSDAPVPTYKTPYNKNLSIKYWEDAKNGGRWND